MSEELEKLHRLLDRATAAEDVAESEIDGETASLREAWIAFGRLLEAAEPPAETALGSLPLPPRRPRRRIWPAAGLLAASLLLCAVAMWRLQSTSRPQNASPLPVQTASTGVKQAAPAKEEQQPAASAPQWDDSFDEQVTQLGRQVLDVQQGSFAWADSGAAVQAKIERLQQDFKDNGL